MPRLPMTVLSVVAPWVLSVGCGEALETAIGAPGDASSTRESGSAPQEDAPVTTRDSGRVSDSGTDTGTDGGPACPAWPGVGKDGKANPGPMWAGGSPVALTTYSSNNDQPFAFAVDDSHLYWQTTCGDLSTCPIAGCPDSGPTLLYTAGFCEVDSLVAYGGTAYFVTFNSSGSNMVVDSCPAAACSMSPNTVYSHDTTGLTGDGKNLYFQAFGKGLLSCPIGPSCTPTVLTNSAPEDTGYWPMFSTGTEVFYVEQAGGDTPFAVVQAVPVTGGTPRTVCTITLPQPDAPQATSLVVAGRYVYVADDVNISQCPIGGGTQETYATDVAPDQLATDGTNVYWTNLHPRTTATVAMCKVGPTCCQAQTIATNQSPDDTRMVIAVTPTAVFWTSGTGIYQATK
jgi:hypothetical protein